MIAEREDANEQNNVLARVGGSADAVLNRRASESRRKEARPVSPSCLSGKWLDGLHYVACDPGGLVDSLIASTKRHGHTNSA